MIQVNIQKFLEKGGELEEREDIYPQADDLDKIFDLISFISKGIKTKGDVADFFGFQKRQASYYFNALNYLGFAEKSQTGYVLTKKGIEISTTCKREIEIVLFIEQITKRKTWNLFFTIYFLKKEELTKQKVIEILKNEFNDKYSENTLDRRAKTVLSWCKWLDKNIDKFN